MIRPSRIKWMEVLMAALCCGMVVDDLKNGSSNKMKYQIKPAILSSTTTVIPPPILYKDALLSLPFVTFKADSGASGRYVCEKDKHVLNKIKPTATSPKVCLPDSTLIQATKQGDLPLTIPVPAHVFPDLSSSSLLSLGALCDQDCSAVLTKHDLRVFDSNHNLIVLGHRNYCDGLWDVRIPSSFQSEPMPAVNAILQYDKSKSELAEYFHACCGSPTKSTFLQAIKQQGNFATWPGLTHDLISKHLSPSIATSKGHLTQER